jgi:hypothetical protein
VSCGTAVDSLPITTQPVCVAANPIQGIDRTVDIIDCDIEGSSKSIDHIGKRAQSVWVATDHVHVRPPCRAWNSQDYMLALASVPVS